jgi:branched-subunit amino acid transport protein
MSAATLWVGVLACAAGCYAFKLLGLSVPESVLERPFVRRMAALLPVALLSALVAVGTFADGKALTIDARAFGVAAALIALLLRAPFLVVVIVGAAVAAGLRLLGMP